jgi:glyoxalase family protein
VQDPRAAGGIHHVSLVALNAQRTVRFYVEVLGLHAGEQELADERSNTIRAWIGDDRGTTVAIVQSADGRAGNFGIGTIDHVALTVESFESLLKWKRRLQDNKVLVYGPYDQQAYQDIVFTDPDGVLLEIATTGPGWEATQDGRDVFIPPVDSMAPYRNEEEMGSRTWREQVTEIAPDMALQGFHHISAVTSSLQKADRFYRGALRLPLVRKTLDHDDPEVRHWYWGLDGGRHGTVVTAFPIVHRNEGGKRIHGRAGVGVADHFALALDVDDEALAQWSNDLVTRGLEVTSGSSDGYRSISVHSPDGYVVELVAAQPEPAEGATVGEPEHVQPLHAGISAGKSTAEPKPGAGKETSE